MNGKILVFVICLETIMYLLLYNLHDCTFRFCFICGKKISVKPNLFDGNSDSTKFAK